MIRALALAVLFLASGAFAQTPGKDDQVFSMPSPKDCGLITRFSPNMIPAGCMQGVDNIYFDQDWSMLRRGGYALYNLTAINSPAVGPVKGLWPFYGNDGTRYLVAFSSGSMWSSRGDGQWSVIPGLRSLASSAEMQCVQAMSYLWCTDGVDPVFRTDIASTATIAGAPQGTLISTFRNRLVIANVPGSATLLYLSGELDGTDWMLNFFPNVSTSPAVISISGTNDGLPIRCLLGQFQGQFLVGRDYDLYGLSGYSNQDFALRRISQQVGCIEAKSPQEVNNVLYWMSKRGVEGFTGTQIEPVSYPITPTINQIIAAAGNTQTKTLSSQLDWQSGNLCASGLGACMSATISPGNVVPSTWGVMDSSFSGTFALPLSTESFSLSLATAAFIIGNGDFETGSIFPWACNTTGLQARCGIVATATTTIPGTYSGQSKGYKASAYVSVSPFAAIKIKDDAGNTRINYDVIADGKADCAVHQKTFDLGALSSMTLYIELSGGDTGGSLKSSSTLTSSTFTAISSVTLVFIAANNAICLDGTYDVGFDRIDAIMVNRYFDISTSTRTWLYLSQVFDSHISTPIGGAIYFSSFTDVNSAIAIAARSGKSLTGPFTVFQPVIDGDSLTSGNEFYQYEASMTITISTPTTPRLFPVTLTAATTGYYITPCVMVSSPTSWGLFQSNGVTSGGSLSFWLSTGASCAASTATTANWTPQAVNAQISVTTATPYIAARVLFSLSIATQVPTLNDITFNWNLGSARPPVASVTDQRNGRYYLFYTTSTASGAVNDHAVVYDFNNKWTLLDDITAYSATLYLNEIYVGDSGATGNVYQLESGQSDNGKPFTMSFQTGDMDMGNPAMNKNFERMYLFVSAQPNPSQDINITCGYTLDGSNVSYSLGSFAASTVIEASGYGVAKFPFPTGQVVSGHWININCSYTGAEGPERIYGLKLVYKEMSWE